MAKKEKKEEVLEPAYYMSAINTPVLNYKVYYMSKKEKIGYFLLAFIVGAAVGYLFYGGLAKDAYGYPTMITYFLNTIICTTVGVIAGKLFLPMRTNQIINKRTKELNQQFRDMLDGLTTSLGAGNNIPDSFKNVYNDLKVQYEEGEYILNELKTINAGIQNSIAIEDLLFDFGVRSGNDDIMSFADVFKVSYRKGGNIGDIIRNTHEVLSEKMEIREEIETMIAANKSDTLMMVFMPIIMVVFIKMGSPDFAKNFTTVTGVISTTIAIVCFVGAYKLSDMMTDIKI